MGNKLNLQARGVVAIKVLRMKILFLLALFLLIIPVVYAHCPLCTAAVGTAAVTAKYYGMDTSIIGIFIGAFSISVGLWIALKLKRKYIKFQTSLIVLLSFVLTVIPIVYGVSSDSIYLPLMALGINKIYWLNKLLFGSIVGGLLCLIGYGIHSYIKKTRGRVLFPYQGIAITLASLLVTSLIFYLIIK